MGVCVVGMQLNASTLTHWWWAIGVGHLGTFVSACFVSIVNKYNICSYIYVVLLALALPVTFNQGDGSGVHPNKTVGSLSRSQAHRE